MYGMYQTRNWRIKCNVLCVPCLFFETRAIKLLNCYIRRRAGRYSTIENPPKGSSQLAFRFFSRYISSCRMWSYLCVCGFWVLILFNMIDQPWQAAFPPSACTVIDNVSFCLSGKQCQSKRGWSRSSMLSSLKRRRKRRGWSCCLMVTEESWRRWKQGRIGRHTPCNFMEIHHNYCLLVFHFYKNTSIQYQSFFHYLL